MNFGPEYFSLIIKLLAEAYWEKIINQILYNTITMVIKVIENIINYNVFGPNRVIWENVCQGCSVVCVSKYYFPDQLNMS